MTPASGPAGGAGAGDGAGREPRGGPQRGELGVGDGHGRCRRRVGPRVACGAAARPERDDRHRDQHHDDGGADDLRPSRTGARPAVGRLTGRPARSPRERRPRRRGRWGARPRAPAGARRRPRCRPCQQVRPGRALDQRRGLLRVGGAGAVGRAVGGEGAGAAGGLAGVAHPAAVEDHLVRHDRPVALGHQRADGVLDLDRVLLLRPSPAPDEPAEVRVDGDAGDVERVAEDHVGGLAPDPRQLDELVQRVGQLTAVLLDDGGAEPDQRVGLVPEEAGAVDHLLQLGPIGLRVVERRGVARRRARG